MHWLVTNYDSFDLFPYHNILIFVFDPISTFHSKAQTTLRNIIHVAVSLSMHSYTCDHVIGEKAARIFCPAAILYARR